MQPVFHAFTGCETASTFGGQGKKDSLMCFESISKAFEDFMLMEDNIGDLPYLLLERFVVLLYDQTSHLIKVLDAGK